MKKSRVWVATLLFLLSGCGTGIADRFPLLQSQTNAPPPVGVEIKKTDYPIPSPTPTGRLWYVATPEDRGSATNDGKSPKSPITLNAALLGSGDGDVVLLKGGTYRPPEAMTVSHRITLQPLPSETVWIKGSIPVQGWRKTSTSPAIWTQSGWTYPAFEETGEAANHVVPEYPAAALENMIYVDGAPLAEVRSLAEVGPGKFFFGPKDADGKNSLYIGSDPNGRVVEVTRASEWLTLSGAGAANSVVQGLGFAHFAEFAVRTTGDTTGIGIYDNTFAWDGLYGMWLSGPNQHVKGNRFEFNGYKGIKVGGTDGSVIEENYLAYNTYENFRGAAALKVGASEGTLVRNNIAEYNFSNAFRTDVSAIGVKFVANIARNNEGVGFAAEISDATVFASNLAVDNSDFGFNVLNSTGTKLINNTVVDGENYAIQVVDTPRDNDCVKDPEGCDPTSDLTWITGGTVMKNNLLSSTKLDAASALLNGQAGGGTLTDASQLFATSDFNAYHRKYAGVPTAIVEWTKGTVFATVAEFALATGFESSGLAVEGEIGFVDPLAGRYELAATSPAKGKGTLKFSDEIAALMGVAGATAIDMGIVAPVGFPAPPAPIPVKEPTSLAITAGSECIPVLTWIDASFNETGFQVERRFGLSGIYQAVGVTRAGEATFTDSPVSGIFYYRVRALQTGRSSEPSPEVKFQCVLI